MANPVSLSELDKALDALILDEAPPMLEDTDITIMRLVSRAKCSPPKAKRMLDEWTKAGKAEYLGKRREMRGHKVDAWRLTV
jgi:hypothetical protein